MSQISSQIQSVITGPVSVTTDGTTVSQPNVRDMIAADQYLSKVAAARKPWQVLQFARISFPGAVR